MSYHHSNKEPSVQELKNFLILPTTRQRLLELIAEYKEMVGENDNDVATVDRRKPEGDDVSRSIAKMDEFQKFLAHKKDFVPEIENVVTIGSEVEILNGAEAQVRKVVRLDNISLSAKTISLFHEVGMEMLGKPVGYAGKNFKIVGITPYHKTKEYQDYLKGVAPK